MTNREKLENYQRIKDHLDGRRVKDLSFRIPVTKQEFHEKWALEIKENVLWYGSLHGTDESQIEVLTVRVFGIDFNFIIID